VRQIAELVWRTRGAKDARRVEREAAMQRLTRIAGGDPDSTRYGLELAQDDAERAEH